MPKCRSSTKRFIKKTKNFVMTYKYSMLYKTCTLQFVVKVEL